MWFILAAALAQDAPAPPPPSAPSYAEDRLFYTHALFVRVNPLGLQDQLRIGYRRDLIRKPGALFADSYVFLSGALNVTPAFIRVGPQLEIWPLSILKFEAGYQYVGYFGAFDQLTWFDDTNDRFSDRTLDDLPEVGGRGHMVNVGGRLQARVGPIVVRGILEFNWYDLNQPTGTVAFYEQFFDRMVVDRGWIVRQDVDLLGAVSKAKFGARYTWSDSLIGDGSVGDAPHHRVGPLFAWEFHDRGQGARFDKPTLFVLAQWWVAHPYRAGQEQPQGLPMIAIGTSWQGDLLGPKPKK